MHQSTRALRARLANRFALRQRFMHGVRSQRNGIMNIGWQQFFGFGIAAVGAYWIIKRHVPIGIEGQPPSFHARGWLSVTLGVVGIVIGLVVAFDVPKQIKIDSCLDHGGSVDAQTGQCIFDRGSKQ
jgi:hypothetical protein